MKHDRHSLKISHCVRTACILVMVAFMQSSLLAADISGLLDKKGPKAKEVFTKPTITRVTELHNLPLTSQQYEFLIDHPRLSMALARLSDPSLDSYKVTVRPNALLHVEDPGNLAGDVEVIASDHGRRIYFISGYYDLMKIRFYGHVLMVTEYGEKKVGNREFIDTKATSYIKVNNAVVGVFTRVFNLLFPKKVDGRIGRFTKAVRSAAVSVYHDPEGAYSRLSSSGEANPVELKEFAALFSRQSGH